MCVVQEKAVLCYINARNMIFGDVDFNFDNKYKFHIEIDRSKRNYEYYLHVEKKKGLCVPDGFYGENISAVNVIAGKNGAGKTSILKYIINNIGSGMTAMSGEGVIYIVNINNRYILFHNCKTIHFDKTIEECGIDLIESNQYFKECQDQKKENVRYSNEYFWKNIVFFSNYFGSANICKNSKFVIDISKDKEVAEIAYRLGKSKQVPEVLQNEYQKQQHLKILKYMENSEFKKVAERSNISLPNLVHFSMKKTYDEKFVKLYEQQKNRFPNRKWIGKNRYPTYEKNGYLINESKFEFEAAINKFSVCLMWYLKEKKVIDETCFELFINQLAETDDLSGVHIAYKLICEVANNDCMYWERILCFLNDDSKRYVLYWQSDDEFVYEWKVDDINLLKQLLENSEENLFYTCDLVSNCEKGQFSSGEESKVRLFVSLYDAYVRITESKENTWNRSLILLLDEVDAYYHPEYQIRLMNGLLEVISEIFKEYYVQVILTCNTPLELSDIPNTNIVYLEKAEVSEQTALTKTFGGNVCTLLKNNFFINSSMGDFAKKKINQAISFLNGSCDSQIQKEEVKYIISIIGEPIIQEKLEKMYYQRFPEELPDSDIKIKFYQDKIKELQSYIINGKIIDERVLDKLKDYLQEVDVMLEEIKRGEKS